MSEDRDHQLTVGDFSSQCRELMRRYASAAADDVLTRNDMHADMLYFGYMPPTRWQRFKFRLRDLRQRAKDIWTILSGGDVHENCGY